MKNKIKEEEKKKRKENDLIPRTEVGAPFRK